MGDSALLRSLQRLAPIVEVVEEEEVELDDVDARAELAAIERLSDDIREFLARPVAAGETVDVTELVDAIVASRVDEASLAQALAVAIMAALPAPVTPDNSVVIDAFAAVTKELASLRKKMSGVAASGGGGGYGEVALRTANKEPVGPANPLPITFDSDVAVVVEGQPRLVGVWDSVAGVSGTETLTGSKRIVGVMAHFTTAGTVQINATTVPCPAGLTFNWNPNAQVTDPTLIFTGSDSYFVEYVT